MSATSSAGLLLPSLPGAVADRYAVGPVSPADAADIFALVCACDEAILGYADWSLEDVESEIGPGAGDRRDQALVRESGTGRAVTWVWADPRAGTGQYTADVYVDPALPEADGDVLSAAGWVAIVQWARGWYAQFPAESPYLAVGSLQGDTATERRLAEAGFERQRTFWRMRGEVPAEPLPAPVVPGLTIAVADDPRLVHRLRDDSFVDHWDDHAMAYDDWLARQRGTAGHDESLWFVASVDGEPAAIMLASRQMAADDALYVATLGTLRAFRGRGVAGALLHHAFEVARREGYRYVTLGVDSDSPTGAPSVYRRAGLDVQFAMDAWHRPLG